MKNLDETIQEHDNLLKGCDRRHAAIQIGFGYVKKRCTSHSAPIDVLWHHLSIGTKPLY